MSVYMTKLINTKANETESDDRSTPMRRWERVRENILQKVAPSRGGLLYPGHQTMRLSFRVAVAQRTVVGAKSRVACIPFPDCQYRLPRAPVKLMVFLNVCI